ncbi:MULTISPECIES: lytic transglycosylase domain-containing protein [unclassified Acidovorax]|uniref:lytic transglycosylase domain-containing protein n=1 Tax=unclassified Acidovorax TaxID=2684926 RepID=UPI000B3F7952|nr:MULTISPECIES: transglycosylase SLT domain-containing protein [unclassified Acidovorax]MBP3979504.1 transglycosylase SLT domain-containing protein [Acidovorax sp. JG5]
MHASLSILAPLSVVLSCALGAGAVRAQGGETDSNRAASLRQEAIAYEHGEGVARDPLRAVALYCASARLGDMQAQYNLGWMYAHGRGVARDDVAAAYFFRAAAEQGLGVAARMLQVVGGATDEVPECLRPPPPSPPAQLVAAPPGVNYQLTAPRKIVELVLKMAPQYQVEPQLALAIIAAESNFNTQALSPKNAQGLMQLIPETSERFNVKNPYDPAQNIRGGLTYLRWLLAYFEGDVALVAAAYNAGEGKVERYRGVPPYLETRAYVQRILKAVGATAHPFDRTVAPPSPALERIRLALRRK